MAVHRVVTKATAGILLLVLCAVSVWAQPAAPTAAPAPAAAPAAQPTIVTQPAAKAPDMPVTLPSGTDLSKPLTLQEAVHIALVTNPTMNTAYQQVRQAQAAYRRTRAGELPNLQANWQGAETQALANPNTFNPGRRTTRAAYLSLTQVIFQSGLHQQIGAANAQAKAAAYGEQDTRRTLVYNVAQSYFTAVAAVGLAQVARRTVADSQEHLTAAQARISAGTAAQADLYPFQVELAQAKVNAIAAEDQVNLSLNNLKQAMGLPASVGLKLAALPARPPLPGKVEDLIKTAYATRPDVKQLEQQIESARLLREAARIDTGPTVSANGYYDYGKYTDLTGEQWQLSVGVSMPIFDGGLTKANLASADAALRQAEDNLQQTRLSISNEVHNAYLQAVEADARITAANATVRNAEVNLNAAQQKYNAGVGIYLDVTDAETSLAQAQAAQVQAVYDYNNALAALRSAVGEPAVAGAY